MTSFARAAVAITLSVLAVAALTWAGWPRPRSVLPFETGEPFVFVDERDEDAPPYRLIRHPYGPAGPAAFWFLSPEGNLLGPWEAGRCAHSLGFDGRGRFLACTPPPDSQCERSDGGGYELARYDPATGRAETLVTPAADGPDRGDRPRRYHLSGDRMTLATLSGTEPLAFDFHDLDGGRTPPRLTLPGRAGGLRSSSPLVATLVWGLSPDGRELALGEAWDGAKRAGPPGIEVYDIATGKLARRLPHLVLPPRFPGGPEYHPGEVGVGSFEFTADRKGVKTTLVRRSIPSPDFPVWRAEAGLDSPECDFATGEQRWPTVPPANPDPAGLVAADGERFLYVCRSPTLFRVTDTEGAPLGADWQPLPGRFAASEHLATEPHHGRAVVHCDTQAAEELPDWVLWLTRQRARPAGAPAPTRCRYLYHDWSAGEFRPMSGTGGGSQSHAVGPYGLAILTSSPAGGTLALWDLPPRSAPWPWSIPAGVALGVLLTSAGVRLRRRLPAPSP